MANKILFKLEGGWNDSVTLIANNHKDLQEYLIKEYNWYKINISEDSATIVRVDGFEKEYASIEWVTQI